MHGRPLPKPAPLCTPFCVDAAACQVCVGFSRCSPPLHWELALPYVVAGLGQEVACPESWAPAPVRMCLCPAHWLPIRPGHWWGEQSTYLTSEEVAPPSAQLDSGLSDSGHQSTVLDQGTQTSRHPDLLCKIVLGTRVHAQLSARCNVARRALAKEPCSVPGLFLGTELLVQAEPADLSGVLVISQILGIQGSRPWPFPSDVWSPVDTSVTLRGMGNLGFRVSTPVFRCCHFSFLAGSSLTV